MSQHTQLIRRILALPLRKQREVLMRAGIGVYSRPHEEVDLLLSLRKHIEQQAYAGKSDAQAAACFRLWAAVNYVTKEPVKNPFPRVGDP